MNIENRELSQKLVDTIDFLKQSISKISVYDLNYYSMTELYYGIANKINELIETYHEFGVSISEEVVKQNECLQYLLNDGLITEVVNKINELVADGTMDTIINHNVFAKLYNQIEDIAINVKTLGVKGDGSDEYTLIQNIFNSHSHKTLYFPNGVYGVSSTLVMNTDCSIVLAKNAEIKALAPMDYLFKLNTIERVGTYNMTFKDYIKGGCFNGNYLADNIMGLAYFIGFTLDDIKFLNFNKVGLNTRLATPSNELIATNLYFRNDKPVLGSKAIVNNGRDNEFRDIIIRDTQYGIDTSDSRFSNVHGWIGYQEILEGSYMVKTFDGYVQLNMCYADTYQYPFISCFGAMAISNSSVLWNNDIYTDAKQLSHPVCVFKSENTDFAPTTYGGFITSNVCVHAILKDTLLTNMYLDRNDFAAPYIRTVKNGSIDYTNFKYKDKSVKGGYGGNIDDIKEPGSYSIVSGVTGIPTGAYNRGQLIVNTSSSKPQTESYQFITQIYVPSDKSRKVYIRYWSANWGEWITLSSNVNSVISDANNVLTPGSYSVVNTTQNMPKNAYGWGQLICNISSTSNNKDDVSFGTQIFIPSSPGGKLYFRYFANNTFSSWYLVTGSEVV